MTAHERHADFAALAGRRASIWLCSRDTRGECLQRSLFGDGQSTNRWFEPSAVGDLAFLFDYEADELLGVFETLTALSANLEPDAWGERFPCQVRVRPIGAVVVLKNAARTLKAAGVAVRRSGGGALLPMKHVLPANAATSLLGSFQAAGQARRLQPPDDTSRAR